MSSGFEIADFGNSPGFYQSLPNNSSSLSIMASISTLFLQEILSEIPYSHKSSLKGGAIFDSQFVFASSLGEAQYSITSPNGVVLTSNISNSAFHDIINDARNEGNSMTFDENVPNYQKYIGNITSTFFGIGELYTIVFFDTEGWVKPIRICYTVSWILFSLVMFAGLILLIISFSLHSVQYISRMIRFFGCEIRDMNLIRKVYRKRLFWGMICAVVFVLSCALITWKMWSYSIIKEVDELCFDIAVIGFLRLQAVWKEVFGRAAAVTSSVKFDLVELYGIDLTVELDDSFPVEIDTLVCNSLEIFQSAFTSSSGLNLATSSGIMIGCHKSSTAEYTISVYDNSMGFSQYATSETFSRIQSSILFHSYPGDSTQNSWFFNTSSQYWVYVVSERTTPVLSNLSRTFETSNVSISYSSKILQNNFDWGTIGVEFDVNTLNDNLGNINLVPSSESGDVIHFVVDNIGNLLTNSNGSNTFSPGSNFFEIYSHASSSLSSSVQRAARYLELYGLNSISDFIKVQRPIDEPLEFAGNLSVGVSNQLVLTQIYSRNFVYGFFETQRTWNFLLVVLIIFVIVFSAKFSFLKLVRNSDILEGKSLSDFFPKIGRLTVELSELKNLSDQINNIVRVSNVKALIHERYLLYGEAVILIPLDVAEIQRISSKRALNHILDAIDKRNVLKMCSMELDGSFQLLEVYKIITHWATRLGFELILWFHLLLLYFNADTLADLRRNGPVSFVSLMEIVCLIIEWCHLICMLVIRYSEHTDQETVGHAAIKFLRNGSTSLVSYLSFNKGIGESESTSSSFIFKRHSIKAKELSLISILDNSELGISQALYLIVLFSVTVNYFVMVSAWVSFEYFFPARVLLIVLGISPIRRSMITFLQTLGRSLEVLLLYVSVVLVFSLISLTAFLDYNSSGSYYTSSINSGFQNSIRSIISIFIYISTTDNYTVSCFYYE